jgi:2-polyprenyl-3-methyl-5-hydroxy-6-metoxy-1,4-benzoquinol methylase
VASELEGIMFRTRGVVVGLVVFACLTVLGAQAPRDDESVWNAFMAWFKAAPPNEGNPLGDYAASLKAAKVPEGEIKRQVAVVTRMLMRERSDWVEPYYDKIFTRPLTGDPETDRFTTAPSAFLVDAARGLAPGTALDAGMGQGRNAVYLAGKGWTVTGFALSAEAVKAATANAGKAGVRIDAIKASYADFDFGTAKWDLVVMTFAWAPVTDPAFVARLRASLRPTGRIVFEHMLEDPEAPRPALMHALKPGQLRELLTGFRLDRYEEFRGLGDWSGPDTLMVRTVAVKQ